LKKGVERGFFCYPWMARDPFLDPIRDDEGLGQVLEMARERHEKFKREFSFTPR
jgi:hypothetical protein